MNKEQQKYSAANRNSKSLRQRMNYAEQRAWATLRKMEGLPGRFRRQRPIGPYVVDFVSHAMKLVVEIDGGIHRLPEVAARDAAREAWLVSQGFTVVRVPNDVAIDADALAARILGSLSKRGDGAVVPLTPAPLPQGERG